MDARPRTDTLRVWGSPTLVRLMPRRNAEGWWDANAAAPPGEQLTAGTTYENAHRFPFNDSSPGFDLGGYGRGCNESTSRFTVDQIAFDPTGPCAPSKSRSSSTASTRSPPSGARGVRTPSPAPS